MIPHAEAGTHRSGTQEAGPDMPVTNRYAVKMLEKALRLYTVSLSERSMAEFLADKCDDLGFDDIRIDEDVGNIIAIRGSGRPVTMLCGHMDTVPGKIRVRRDGDKLYGRGASDAKAPLMAMLFAAASAPKDVGTVVFVGAVDEEGNATGAKSIAKKGMRDKDGNVVSLDYAIFGEPSGIAKITVGYKGRLAINLRVDVGNSGHAGAPWLSKNAIDESIAFAAELQAILEDGNGEKKKIMMLTATVTEIRGGSSHNMMPQECETTIDVRIPPNMDCKSVERNIATCVRKLSAERGVEAFYSILDETEPFEASADSMLVRALKIATVGAGQKSPMPVLKTGTGDMNIVGNALGIPVVTWGPGDPHMAHMTNEYVSIAEYLKSIEILGSTLRHLKTLHDKRRA